MSFVFVQHHGTMSTFSIHSFLMIQVKTFTLPTQEDEANEFLASVKPTNINFNTDMIVVFHEDGTYDRAQEIADIQELVVAQKKQRFQLEVAMHMMEAERAEINSKRNKGKWDELTTAIIDTKKQLDLIDMKVGFAEEKIRTLEA